MVIDRAVHNRAAQGRFVLAGLAVLALMWAGMAWADGDPHAGTARKQPTAAKVGIVDARHAGKAAHLYFSLAVPARRLSYFRLSDPAATASQCCVAANGRTVANNTVLRRAESGNIGTRRAPATLAPGSDEGFIGIAFEAQGVAAERLSPHHVRVAWPQRKQSLDAFHCLSSEGLHVRVADTATGAEVVRYYVPLGSEVDADCTDALMPMR